MAPLPYNQSTALRNLVGPRDTKSRYVRSDQSGGGSERVSSPPECSSSISSSTRMGGMTKGAADDRPKGEQIPRLTEKWTQVKASLLRRSNAYVKSRLPRGSRLSRKRGPKQDQISPTPTGSPFPVVLQGKGMQSLSCCGPYAVSRYHQELLPISVQCFTGSTAAILDATW